MNKILRIKKEDAVLVAVDFQEKLLPAMHDWEKVEKNMIKLSKGLNVLDVPKIVTQQYTKGLGPTVESIAQSLGTFEPVEKVSFSAYENETFRNQLNALGKRTVILTGIEAHICVEQTALDLLENGYLVALVSDCIESRDSKNKKVSIKRLRDAGVLITSCESVLYEMLGSAAAPQFKQISSIVK